MKISKILLSVALSFISFTSMADNNITSPDFAFPVKVRQNADIQYQKAIKSGDEKAALRALVDASLAQTAIAPDSAGIVAEKIETFAADCKNPAVSALAFLFTARIYDDVYSSDRWVFNSRSLPAEPVPANIQAWDGKMFRNKINSLCDSAIVLAPDTEKTPLADFKNIVTVNSDAKAYFPTVTDFIISSVIDIKTSFLEYSGLPLATLSISSVPDALYKTRPETFEILSLYDRLLSINSNSPAPYLYFATAKLQFVRNRAEGDSEKKYIKQLNDLYLRYSTSQYSILPLLRIAENTNEQSENLKEVYELLQNAAKKFPSSALLPCVKNQIKRLSQKSVEISHRNTLCPGDEIKVAVTGRNLNSATISLYKLPDNFMTSDDYVSITPGAVKISTKSISFTGSVPFQDNDTVSFRIDKPGRYIIVPSFSGAQTSRQSYQVLHVSALSLGTFIGDRTNLIVVEPFSGAPVKNAEIIGFLKKNRSTTTKKLGITDQNGFASLIDPFSGNIRPVKGEDRFALDSYLYSHNNREQKAQNNINLFCDLPIYHPGDSVNWACVAYSSTQDKMEATTGKKLKIVFMDANRTPVDTVEVTTDAFGRASGSFKIPEGLLTGRYLIKASGDNMSGAIGILVSDYKLPTYSIDNISVENDTPQKGSTTITGIAKTYSGIPLSGIVVKLELSTAPRWWRAAASSNSFFSDETSTDNAGKFTFVITQSDYSLANDDNSVFSAKITGTSSTGESVAAYKRYSLGTKYNLTVDVPTDIDISNPLKLNASIENVEGEKIKEPISIKVLRNNNIVKEISYNGTSLSLDDMQSGVYDFEFSAENAQPVKIENIALYRPTDFTSPRKSLLWVPTHAVYSGDSILLGTTNETTHILLTVSEKNKILSHNWLALPAGMHHIPVNLPQGCDSGELWLYSMANYNSATEKIIIKPRTPAKRISIVTETWRDKLIPGAQETVTFKVMANDSSAATSAIMLDMYNAALLTFGSHSLEFTPGKVYSPSLSFSAPRSGYNSYSSLYSPLSFLHCTSISVPDLNTYGRNFGQPLMIKGMRMMSANMARSAGKAEFSDDAVMMTEAKMAYNGAADFAMAEEAEVTEEVADAGSSENSPEKDSFDYRDSNVALAFFSPMLTTDSAGRLSYTFTVPNANTTWVLDALAYTSDLETATLSKTAVASKPIMVTPNLPRFLRTGDVIMIESQVFNATDGAVNATTTVEILNPQNGEIIHSEICCNEINANSSATVSTKFVAPSDLPFICFRIKASTNSYADGEQALIPVLPSSTPVIESTDFYVPADEKKFKIQLPEYSNDAKVTLTYCNNPVWYVLTALPGLQQNDPSNAVEAANNIFSAAVAQGLVKTYPEIGEALAYWLNNPTDSTLTSMLERNSDMKSILLAATPWMQDAQNDSERMTRLALLLNNKECDNTIAKAVKTLKELQAKDGGIAWMKQYDLPSLWITTSVLNTLGRLNALGFMPENEDFGKLIVDGLKYIQTEYSAIYSKYPDSDFRTYAETVSLYPAFNPSTIGRSMISVTTQRILKDWKNMDMAAKARAALLLYRTGNKATAATILQSLDEYATVSPERGMWWQSLNDRSASLSSLIATASALNAYSTITPGVPQIEKISQWLILQKQATNWGNSASATEIVAAILTSVPKWVTDSDKVRIELDDNSLKTNPKAYTGEVKINLDPKKASKSVLTIAKSSTAPVWGSVVSFETKNMPNVKAAGCDQLRINKKILVKVGDNWKESDTYKVGDKVKISLNITSGNIIDYLAITDSRAACLEPVEQIPSPIWSDGICFYRENRDSSTNIFIDRLPKGTFILEYEMWVNNSGEFSSGIATAQSQYAPEITAHSGGNILTVMQ